MAGALGRVREVVALGIVLAGVLRAFALDPSLDVSQYAHTSWKVSDGFAKGSIMSITQTPDGYLWLGTEFGLLRFDGVRSVPWQPPLNQQLPSGTITSLLATSDGTLWIGTIKGLASWNRGKLTQYPELTAQVILTLLEDRNGTLWVGSGGVAPHGRLCGIQNATVRCFGEDGSFGDGLSGLYEDRKGNLWAVIRNGLWRWKPGPPKFFPVRGPLYTLRAFGEDDDGALLIRTSTGIKRFVDGKITDYALPEPARQFQATKLLHDRNGGLWIGTHGQGLMHVHQGKIDVFAQSDGLSSEDVSTIFEDREANIWVVTIDGLDRFRDFAVATFSARQGLSDSSVASVLADRNGSTWLATNGGLNRWKTGQFTIVQTGGAKPDGKLNGLAPRGLFQDAHGRIWVSTGGGVGYLENDRFILSRVPGRVVYSFAEDTAGNLWMTDQTLGLLRLSRRTEVEQIPWASLGGKGFAGPLVADPLQGGLWLGFYRGGLAYFANGQVRTSYSAADGLGEGRVNSLRFDRNGTLWASTEGGLSQLKNGRISTLTSKNGLPCDTVHWTVEDDAHSFWLYTPCGLLRIPRSELDAWVGNPKRTIQATVLDSSDGVRNRAVVGSIGPLATKSSDGRLWFVSLGGVSVVDPSHLPFNKLPPSVHIEQITADNKTYDPTSRNGNIRLPPRIRDLQIDYTALSLVAPEKVFFRYELEGWDRDWQDVGTRRQAFYSNLPPRNYTFRVIACNNSGVWNESGASLDFSVAPAYYQTIWFRSLCAIAFLALVAGLHQLRLRQLARQFNMRLEERVNERTRIARDLHDTLLQSFQGVLLKFHAVTYLLPEQPAEAQKSLETTIEQARQAISEGRDTVHGLRSSAAATADIVRALSVLGEQLAADQTNQNRAAFRVHVEGTPRNLAAIVCDEVYRIAGEALRNAFRHGHAGRVELEIRYDRRQFRLRVRDDGKGIDPKVLGGDGRPGHYGLPGMHERARLAGGKLTVWSEIDSGTEAELTIPGSVAYAKPFASRWPTILGRGA